MGSTDAVMDTVHSEYRTNKRGQWGSSELVVGNALVFGSSRHLGEINGSEVISGKEINQEV